MTNAYMKLLNRILLFITLSLLIGYFFISLLASFYAITQGWGLSILILFAVICIANLIALAFVKLKYKSVNGNKNITVVSIVISVIVLLLTMKSMVGVNQQIELYNAIKNFSN